jgi:hypothetical protein
MTQAQIFEIVYDHCEAMRSRSPEMAKRIRTIKRERERRRVWMLLHLKLQQQHPELHANAYDNWKVINDSLHICLIKDRCNIFVEDEDDIPYDDSKKRKDTKRTGVAMDRATGSAGASRSRGSGEDGYAEVEASANCKRNAKTIS